MSESDKEKSLSPKPSTSKDSKKVAVPEDKSAGKKGGHQGRQSWGSSFFKRHENIGPRKREAIALTMRSQFSQVSAMSDLREPSAEEQAEYKNLADWHKPPEKKGKLKIVKKMERASISNANRRESLHTMDTRSKTRCSLQAQFPPSDSNPPSDEEPEGAVRGKMKDYKGKKKSDRDWQDPKYVITS